MSFFRRILKVIIGLVFFASAMAKLIDPVGTRLIVEGYMDFFHIPFLKPAAYFVGQALSLVEATVSVMLVTGVWRRVCAVSAMVLLGFFTLVSIVLVIFNPQMSCGCFGKAFELTHTQTLVKNLILWALAIPAFIPVYRCGKPRRHRYAAFAIAEVMVLMFAVYSMSRIPLADYTEFTPSNLIVSENRLGEFPEASTTLAIWDASGEDFSEVLLDGRVAVVSIYDADGLDEDEITGIASFCLDAANAGWYPIVLASGVIDIPAVESYMADYRKLITLNRSNGGVTFLEDGYIIRKFDDSSRPDFEMMESMQEADSVEMYVDAATKDSVGLQLYILAILAIMLLV